ncbi:MAG: hypothetical protein ACLQPD_24130 [Desulfomonilaceae bacterium]
MATMDLTKLKGKKIAKAEQDFPNELRLTFTDGTVLFIDSGAGHSERISEVTSEWIFEPLELCYRETTA